MQLRWSVTAPDSRLSVADIHDPDHGVVAVHLPPPPHGRGGIAREILMGLGKDPEAESGGGRSGREWRYLGAWLSAHRVTDVVVAGIEWLRPREVRITIDRLSDLDVRVWLWAVPPFTDLHRAALASGEELAPEAFIAQWTVRRRAIDAPSKDEDPGWPNVPIEDFPTFRAACRRLLDAEQFAWVDGLYCDAFARASALAVEVVDEDGVADLLHSGFATSEHHGQMHTVLRATQAALFCRGWLLNATLPEFLAAVELRPRAVIRSETEWRMLGSYLDPEAGAITAMVASDLEVEQVVGLRLHDVRPDGSAVLIDGKPRRIEEPGQVFVRAQLEYRRRSGAGDGDHVFLREHGQPASSASLHRSLRSPVRRLGLSLVPPRLLRQAGTSTRWLKTHGLRLERIA